MFDEKNDIDFRSILEGAEEEVPASVWEGVSAGLDKAARGKVVALWFRRAGIATVAAAAIAGMLLVLPDDNSADIVPGAEDSDMIAVVDNDPVIPADTAETAVPELIYVAKQNQLRSLISKLQNRLFRQKFLRPKSLFLPTPLRNRNFHLTMSRLPYRNRNLSQSGRTSGPRKRRL
jgi:hypothetical protein